MYYATGSIDYTTGLIIAALLLVVLWSLLKLDQRKAAKDQEEMRKKVMDDLEKQIPL